MTPDQFIYKYIQVKELIRGHGPQIANDSGVKLTTYYNAVRGLVSDPDVLESIWDAMRAKVNELTANITTHI